MPNLVNTANFNITSDASNTDNKDGYSRINESQNFKASTETYDVSYG